MLMRDYVLDDHVGVLRWTPESSGPADILLRARGRQSQTARASFRVHVHPFVVAAPPVVTILHVPANPTVGTPATFVATGANCQVLSARIRSEDEAKVWRFPCPAPRASFAWTPPASGRYRLTIVARSGDGLTASQTVRFRVHDAGASP